MRGAWHHSGFLDKATAVFSGSLLVQWAKADPPETDLFGGSAVWRIAGGHRSWLAGTLVVLVLCWALVLTPMRWPLLFLAALAGGAYRWPVVATALLPAALVWAPRIPLAHVSGELLYLRIDHVLAAGAFIRMFGSLGVPGRGRRVAAALSVLLMVTALSVGAGIVRGTLPHGAVGLAYLAQACQLAVVFLLALQYAHRTNGWAAPAFALPILLAAGYGVAEAVHPIEALHLGAYKTFERGWFDGQANQFGGLFAAGALAGAAMLFEVRRRGWGVALLAACVAGLWTTDSQQGWLGLGAGLAALVLLGCPRALPFAALALLAMGIWAGPQLLESAVAPGSPAEDRLMAWGAALGQVYRAPVLGLGFGARPRGFYDNHYVLMLAECGMAGLAALSLWLAETGRALGVRFREKRSAMAAAALAMWAAMGVEAGVASVFVVSALGGPVMWYWGIVLGGRDGVEREGAS